MSQPEPGREKEFAGEGQQRWSKSAYLVSSPTSRAGRLALLFRPIFALGPGERSIKRMLSILLLRLGMVSDQDECQTSCIRERGVIRGYWSATTRRGHSHDHLCSNSVNTRRYRHVFHCGVLFSKNEAIPSFASSARACKAMTLPLHDTASSYPSPPLSVPFIPTCVQYAHFPRA